jgi:hypothetical protein
MTIRDTNGYAPHSGSLRHATLPQLVALLSLATGAAFWMWPGHTIHRPRDLGARSCRRRSTIAMAGTPRPPRRAPLSGRPNGVIDHCRVRLASTTRRALDRVASERA